MENQTSFLKNVKYSELVNNAKKMGLDEIKSSVLAIEEGKDYEGCTIPFINYVKSNKIIVLKEIIKTFVSVYDTDQINVLNLLNGAKRFSYYWTHRLGYNALGYKNAYLVDSQTKERFYIG